MDDATQALFGDGLGATLVTTIAARAVGAEKFGIKDWDDPQAREVFARLHAYAQTRGVDLDQLCMKARSEVVGTIRRSQSIDAITREFCSHHAGEVQVLTIGIGLCNRASRLADLPVRWYGSDRSAVVHLRQALIPEDATTLLVGDGAPPDLLAVLDPHLPTLVIAEGLLMYLTPPQVEQMLTNIRQYLREVEFCCDVFHPSTMRGKASRRAAITNSTGARYNFAVAGAAGLATCAPGWKPDADDDVMARLGTAMHLLSRIFKISHHGEPLYCVCRITSSH